MAVPADSTPAPRSVAAARWYILFAALLWSTSGAFTKILTKDTSFQLNEPRIDPLYIAFFRALFAGMVFLPMLRRAHVSFRPAMVPMVICFAVMNAAFVLAMTLGTAANAIVLQYTAPMWMYLGCVWLLGEKSDRRSLVAFGFGLLGIGVIVIGGWERDQLPAVGLGLLSGLTYAGIMLCLRVLQHASALWLTAVNHLFSAVVLIPFLIDSPLPSLPQIGVLFVFGTVQMALPYWLAARSVRVLSPQEAGTITLVEAVVNPVWAYVVSGEEPRIFTLIGGGCILGGLVWRYWPFRRAARGTAEEPSQP
jgi:drug/metabolite transporter (DMT)-like permease